MPGGSGCQHGAIPCRGARPRRETFGVAWGAAVLGLGRRGCLNFLLIQTLASVFSPFAPSPFHTNTHHNNNITEGTQEWLKRPVSLDVAKIQSILHNSFHSPLPSDLPDLNFDASAFSIRSSSLSTFTISPNEATTASSQSTWLPQSLNSGVPAQSLPAQQPDFQAPQRDFQLYPTRRSFESPNAQSNPSVSQSQAFSGSHRRHSSNHISASTLQNQRVAAIIQGTGHSISSPAFTTRYNPLAQTEKQFYASSAPSSSVALQSQQLRVRPQVPLFSQSTGAVPTQEQTFRRNQMAQDMDLFGDYPAYGMDSSDMIAYPDMFNSPAVPTMYDSSMTRSASSSTNVGTVSPQDLQLREPSMSAPNSTAFTNLTSPSMYNESPDFDGYEVSPMFNATDLDAPLGDPWFPLFPDVDASSNVRQSTAEELPLEQDEEFEVSDQLRSNRRRSGTSPGSKASNTSGVRKRNLPLPPIVVEDQTDSIAMKRARNTLAARKSRQKKMERFDELEGEIEKLKEERDHWKSLALARSAAQQ